MAKWTGLNEHPIPPWERVLKQIDLPQLRGRISSLDPLSISDSWAKGLVLSDSAGFNRASDLAKRSIRLEEPDPLWDRAAAWIAHGGSLVIDGPVGSGKTLAASLLTAIGMTIQHHTAKQIGGLPQSMSRDGSPRALYMTETKLLSKLEELSKSKSQDRKTLQSRIDEDLTSNFLVLDEVASYDSRKSWYFRFLAQFIDDRWAFCHTKNKVSRFKQTIFISNVPVEDLEDWDGRSADRIRSLVLHWNIDHESRR